MSYIIESYRLGLSNSVIEIQAAVIIVLQLVLTKLFIGNVSKLILGLEYILIVS